VIFTFVNIPIITSGLGGVEIAISYIISTGLCILGSAYLIYVGLKKYYESKMCIISIVLPSIFLVIGFLILVFFIMILSVGFAGPGGL
jgi:hypothetical protein